MRKEGAGTVGAVAAPVLALPALSPAATEFVQRHPEEARVAVTAALEAVAARFELEDRGIPASLRPFLAKVPQRTDADQFIGVDEAARRLAVSRATVYNWIEARRLLGWRLTRQGTLIPAEQILGPSELVPGIDCVLKIIPAPRAAWRFLSEESPFFDIPRRPLDALKDGRVDEVAAAAAAAGEAFT